MQGVILAAGRGTRMVELTTAVPKPMLEVAGRPLLEYKLEALPDTVNEIVIIVGYKAEVVRGHFGGSYAGKPITYVEQKDQNGTAGALWSAKGVLKDRFLMMAGDDIYAKEDVKRVAEPSDNWRLLVQELPEMHRAGLVMLDENAFVTDIIESREEDDVRWGKGIANCNCMALDTRLFDQPLVPKHEGSLEWGLPQTIVAAGKKIGVRLEPVFTDRWIQITTPNDLVRATETLNKSSS